MIALVLLILPLVIALVVSRHRHLDVGTVTIFVTVSLGLPLLWLAWATLQDARRSRAPVSTLTTVQAANQLAVAVGAQWDAESAVRRLNDPWPLPVSWVLADSSLTDGWTSLVRLATSGAGWLQPPLISTWGASPECLAGSGGDLVDVLGRVPTGRLVILGEPGAGKTMLLVRLVLDLLGRRAPDMPVPFLVSMSSWNPENLSFTGWLANQLIINHPALAASPPTGAGELTQAAALLAAGLILPIVDGLDEIPDSARGAAISQINDSLRPGQHLVVTCRTQQYRDGIRPENGLEVTLRGAAAVELCPLNPVTVGRYLCDDAGGPVTKARWEPVLALLGTEAPVAQALQTPLMVGLARAIYNPRPGELVGILREPSELCDQALADRTAVESLLFDAFIPAAYRQNPVDRKEVQNAERWLMFLAQCLEKIGSPDLAWWQLPLVVPDVLPGTLTALGVGLVMGVAAGLTAAVMVGPGLGVLAAFTIGVPTAMVGIGGRAIEGKEWPPNPTHKIRWESPPDTVIGAGLGTGALLGFMVGIGHGIVAGFVAGVGSAIVVGFAGWSYSLKGTPFDISSIMSPAATLARDRRTALVAGVMAGPPFGIVAGVMFGILAWLLGGARAGVAVGASAGIIVAVTAAVYNSFLAAWPYYEMTRIWLVAHHRLPWSLMDFLDDAYRRGVLRKAGAVYQFRHIEFQRRLAARLGGWPTDRYIKAIDQLGSDKPKVRRRAISSLKRTARQSAAEYVMVMDALSTFIRERSCEPQPSGPNRRASGRMTGRDLQAAAKIIGYRKERYGRLKLDLAGAELPFVELTNAQLNDADLNGADLSHAYLSGADLTGANLAGANLAGAKLSNANLTGANLSGANLAGAKLTDARLTDALWSIDAASPIGWQRDANSGRLKLAERRGQ